MSNAQRKAIRASRNRSKKGGLKRLEVMVQAQDVGLLRHMAEVLRRDDAAAKRMRTMLREAAGPSTQPTVAEVLDTLPDVSGPEFDSVFEEIERFRHDPIMMKVRDVDL
jgi:hypothetical protein